MQKVKTKKIKKDPWEFFVFLLMTPMYSKITSWITIPLAFLQAVAIVVITMIAFSTPSVTTGIRVPLSGGGIIGAIMSIALIQSLLQFVYDNLFAVITLLIIFYIVSFIFKRPPKFKWIEDPDQQ